MMLAFVLFAALMVLVGGVLLTPPRRCACVALSPHARPCPPLHEAHRQT